MACRHKVGVEYADEILQQVRREDELELRRGEREKVRRGVFVVAHGAAGAASSTCTS